MSTMTEREMNNELIERIDAVLESWQGVTVLPDDIYVLQDCKAALTQQQEAEPVFENLMVGNATTLNQDEYPGLGEWWIQLRIGPTHDEVLARVYGNSVSEVRERAAAICNALHQPKPAALQQEPAGYMYEFENPFTGTPLWSHDPKEWNGQKPKSAKPYYFMEPPKPAVCLGHARSRRMSKQPVEPGSLWAHRNGIVYTVLFLANEHTEYPDKYPVMVVYEGGNGRRWTRTLDDWHRSMSLIAHPTGQQEAEPVASSKYEWGEMLQLAEAIADVHGYTAHTIAKHVMRKGYRLHPPKPAAQPVELDRYGPVFLDGRGGGNTEMWHDYIRAELDHAHDFYQSQVAGQAAQPQVPEGIVEKYSELLYHVARKFPNESRHQTALRYIKNAESGEVVCSAAKEEGK